MTRRHLGFVAAVFAIFTACVDVPPETGEQESAIIDDPTEPDPDPCDQDGDGLPRPGEECGGDDCDDNNPIENNGGCDWEAGCILKICDDPFGHEP